MTQEGWAAVSGRREGEEEGGQRYEGSSTKRGRSTSGTPCMSIMAFSCALLKRSLCGCDAGGGGE